MQNFDHNISFCETRLFFAENCRKSQKIVTITSTPGGVSVINFVKLNISTLCDVADTFNVDLRK
jgi:hypothetical protein